MADLRPDAVLLDVMMPDQTASDPGPAPRRADSRVPIVFLTAKRKRASTRSCATWAAGILVKPFDPMLLATSWPAPR